MTDLLLALDPTDEPITDYERFGIRSGAGDLRVHPEPDTLRELAWLMRELGARDALNLDGGGSTTLVLVDPAVPGGFRVANRPSDREGERAVANALALLRSCAEN